MNIVLHAASAWSLPAAFTGTISLVLTALLRGWVVSAKVYETGLRQCEDNRISEVAMQAQVAALYKEIADQERITARESMTAVSGLTTELRAYNDLQRGQSRELAQEAP